MDKKKIGAGFAGALQKATDAVQDAKVVVRDMAAEAKQSREKKKLMLRRQRLQRKKLQLLNRKMAPHQR